MLQVDSPTSEDRSLADMALEGLPEHPAVLLRNGETVTLPNSVSEAFVELLRLVAAGDQPIVVRADRMLTTSEAASLLGLSRQAIANLCDQGQIVHTRIGKHRRLPIDAVLSHRAARLEEKERALGAPSRPAHGPTLELVRALSPRIKEIVERHGASNLRVFGSVARGEAGPESDLDLLVDVPRGTTLIGLANMEDELGEALPWKVDVMSSGAAHGRMEHVNDEAVTL